MRKRQVRTERSVLLVASILFLAIALSQCGKRPRPPNVLFLVVDALRTDHLGLYGYSRDTSPRLAEHARRGVVFDRAYAQAPSTFPSTAVMLTSGYPSDVQLASEHWFKLGQQCTTLPEVLKDVGYRTGFFTANPLHGYESFRGGQERSLGFEQGFDEFFVGSRFYSDRLRAKALDERAMEWIAQDDSGKPFLVQIWYIDPHTPYEPPEEFGALFPDSYESETDWNKEMGKLWVSGKSIPEEARQHLINLYDAEIAYTDSCIGEMLDSLDRKGVLSDTLVIVTADHGEAFHEHGIWVHGHALYEELIHVPLVIIPPKNQVRQEPSRNTSIVGHIDLMPTILDYVGVPNEKLPDAMRGLTLKPLLEGAETAIERHGIAAELKLPFGDYGYFTSRALVTERFKLIEINRPKGTSTTLLFDLQLDPHEQRSLADDPSLKEKSELLTAQLNLILGQRGEAGAVSVPEHIRARLHALGYL